MFNLARGTPGLGSPMGFWVMLSCASAANRNWTSRIRLPVSSAMYGSMLNHIAICWVPAPLKIMTLSSLGHARAAALDGPTRMTPDPPVVWAKLHGMMTDLIGPVAASVPFRYTWAVNACQLTADGSVLI